MKSILTKEERKQIEASIAAAELKTSGELVVMVVRSSGNYAWVFWAWGALGVFSASAIVGTMSAISWGISALQILEWQLLGGSLGLLLSVFASARRGLILPYVRAAKVHRQALLHFSTAGIRETRDRTGILIYVSEFERRVQILADKGIHAIVGEKYWDVQVQSIVEGIRKGQAGKSISDAVAQMGDMLHEHFPRRDDDENELPNTVRGDSEPD